MKAKNLLVAISVIIGIVTMAAGVAVIIDRMLNKNKCIDGYLECDYDDAEITAE